MTFVRRSFKLSHRADAQTSTRKAVGHGEAIVRPGIAHRVSPNTQRKTGPEAPSRGPSRMVRGGERGVARVGRRGTRRGGG